MRSSLIIFLCSVFMATLSCDEDMELGTNQDPVDGNENETVVEIPEVFMRFTDNVTVYGEKINGEEYVVLETDDIPNHPSPYFDQNNPLYTAYDGDNPDFRINPNRISAQSITLKLPLNPREASNKEATPLGAIGIALNGVVFYNQYAGPDNRPLTFEINSFDQYLGHPQQRGAYHYHLEPVFLTASAGKSALLGWLLDGFPVYGPVEEEKEVVNSALDAYHGHFHATEDYPDGIYHYHITEEDPYINGNGFYGVPGIITN